MNVLLKSAMILAPDTPEYHKKKRDILIKNGQIENIAATIKDVGKIKTIQLPNLHISPGWFDSSVCFGEPGFEERETISLSTTSGFNVVVSIRIPCATGAANTDAYETPSVFGMISVNSSTAKVNIMEKIHRVLASNTLE